MIMVPFIFDLTAIYVYAFIFMLHVVVLHCTNLGPSALCAP